MIIVGPTGTGKTHLATALGKKLCRESVGVQFFSLNLFLEECQAEKSSGRYLNFIKRTKNVAVLILDDFGLRNYSHDEAVIIVDLLEERY
ncbi:MAG: ATP-binding protein [Methylotenera sp.]|nr:ATP-binding protein [Oligoflexia bacterium]